MSSKSDGDSHDLMMARAIARAPEELRRTANHLGMALCEFTHTADFDYAVKVMEADHYASWRREMASARLSLTDIIDRADAVRPLKVRGRSFFR